MRVVDAAGWVVNCLQIVRPGPVVYFGTGSSPPLREKKVAAVKG